MLSAAFTNRLAPSSSSTAEHASVVVLSDSQFEPSLVVLRQFVHSALDSAASAKQSTKQSDQARYGRQRQRQRRPHHQEEQNVVLICLEHAPERILPTSPAALSQTNRDREREQERVRIIDATLSGPYRHTAALASTTRHVDLSAAGGGGHDPTTLLLNAVRDSIADLDRTARRREGGGGGGKTPTPSPSTSPAEKEEEEAGDEQKRPVLVVIDSVNALADEFSAVGAAGGGSAAAARCIKRVWETLRGRRGSRLLLVHHDDFPSFPAAAVGPSTSTTAAATTTDLHLLPYLLSPSLSPSTLHLTLRPSAHLELLSREYGLPAVPDEIASDPRTRGFLESLGKRRVGEAWRRPERAEEEDERIQVGRVLVAKVVVDGSADNDSINKEDDEERSGGGGGGCVVEWSSRGLLEDDSSHSTSSSSFGRATRNSNRGTTPFGTSSSSSSSNDAGGGSEVKRVVRMGYTAVQVVRGSGAVTATGTATALEVREVAVGQVLDPRRMGVRAAAGSGGGGRGGVGGAEPAFSSTAKQIPLGPASSSADERSDPGSGRPSTTTPVATTNSALPFSLDLTEQQRLARSRVLNPYAGIDKPIYGEEGYQVPVVPGLGAAGGTGSAGAGGGGGGIEYVADRGDDLDEEDPDEDLEL